MRNINCWIIIIILDKLPVNKERLIVVIYISLKVNKRFHHYYYYYYYYYYCFYFIIDQRKYKWLGQSRPKFSNIFGKFITEIEYIREDGKKIFQLYCQKNLVM